MIYIETATSTEQSATSCKNIEVKVVMLNDFLRLCTQIFNKIKTEKHCHCS